MSMGESPIIFNCINRFEQMVKRKVECKYLCAQQGYQQRVVQRIKLEQRPPAVA